LYLILITWRTQLFRFFKPSFLINVNSFILFWVLEEPGI
jgi:hypothetical protein